ncbi:hypothetical protein Baya_7276 [Bagarius yarrelli]|uniref:Uncharacterized protein n=1 Tax=Bagarius yarrelli TaxID=175774 RepID=A0A556TZR9_BAGYA|nr:hypothetical protein Baya_7276 [Bagarius yarrelli]
MFKLGAMMSWELVSFIHSNKRAEISKSSIVRAETEKSAGLLSGFFRRSPKPPQSCAVCQVAESSDQTKADETPHVPPRPSEEEIRNSITYHMLSVNDTDSNHNKIDSTVCENEVTAATEKNQTKLNQRRIGEDGTGVSEKSLAEQLNEFRLDRDDSEDEEVFYFFRDT